jgi:hypothetical protein
MVVCFLSGSPKRRFGYQDCGLGNWRYMVDCGMDGHVFSALATEVLPRVLQLQCPLASPAMLNHTFLLR